MAASRPAPPRASAAGRHTLVLTGSDPRTQEIAGHLARALRADGGLCTEATDGASYARQNAARHHIRLTDEADHRALLRALDADGRPVDAIVHLGALHAADTEASEAAESGRDPCSPSPGPSRTGPAARTGPICCT
ncbi:hypothetical protein NKH18_51235 [Streptomyces sp. M10(2022)]